jgi:predicted KAP-like P-loop ATPase
MVRGSKPKFSIGIYGEWGTGKTTLMKMIYNELESDENVLTVWFNAWRYEREEQFALIALMKTIAYAMGDLPQYREIKKILLRGAVIVGKGVLRSLVEKWIPLVPKESFDELEKNLLPKMELLSQVDKDTIYFDGLHKIEEEMKKMSNENGKNRIVVFIDDLDRCSPKTALEVFESIKVFLGMEGFIYIVGLSVDTISKLINVAYKDSLVKGEHYIRKIIQIPITIPEWNDTDVIKKLVQNLAKRLDEKYSKLVDENKEVIAKAVEFNPREVKRFINNFIIAREIFSGNEGIKAEELLLVQALKIRWSKFYSYISTDEKFKDEVKKYAEKSEDDRREASTKRKNDKDNPPKGYETKYLILNQI